MHRPNDADANPDKITGGHQLSEILIPCKNILVERPTSVPAIMPTMPTPAMVPNAASSAYK